MSSRSDGDDLGRPAHPSVSAVDETLRASRALLGVIAHSVAEALGAVTLPELRILVILTSHGSLMVTELAEKQRMPLDLVASNVDSLSVPGFVTLSPTTPGQSARVAIAPAGRAIVDEVTARRRAELSAVLDRLAPVEQSALIDAFTLFADAAGEAQVEERLILGL